MSSKLIYLLWPTARPDVFKNSLSVWIDRASNKSIIRIITAVDSTKDEDSLKDCVDCDKILVTNSDRYGVALPAYILSKSLVANPEDIIILASDDYWPPHDWDTYLLNEFNNYDGAIIVKDVASRDIREIVALPIMKYKCLLSLNKIIYHPSYNHQWSDEELWHNLNELNMLKDLRESSPMFEHRHWIRGKRDRDDIDNRFVTHNNADFENFKSRMKMSLKDRLNCDSKYDSYITS